MATTSPPFRSRFASLSFVLVGLGRSLGASVSLPCPECMASGPMRILSCCRRSFRSFVRCLPITTVSWLLSLPPRRSILFFQITLPSFPFLCPSVPQVSFLPKNPNNPLQYKERNPSPFPTLPAASPPPPLARHCQPKHNDKAPASTVHNPPSKARGGREGGVQPKQATHTHAINRPAQTPGMTGAGRLLDAGGHQLREPRVLGADGDLYFFLLGGGGLFDSCCALRCVS
jgi:hypothetical protein